MATFDPLLSYDTQKQAIKKVPTGNKIACLDGINVLWE